MCAHTNSHMSPAQAAQASGVSRWTIMRAIKSHDLQASRDNRNQWRIALDDLDRWRSHTVRTPDDLHASHTPDALEIERLKVEVEAERRLRAAAGLPMPVIVMASPKGGVGKSTCAVLLASEFARMGADVTVLDCDPNRSLSRWAGHRTPKGVTLRSDVGRSDIVPAIRAADGDGRIVIVDLEGVASQLVSRAISQADLVIVPMQPTALDAEIGSEALALVREEEEALGRPIRHAVVLTKTNAAVRSRVQKELETQLSDAGIDLIQPALVNRAAFSELFAYGGDLTDMAADATITTGGNIEKAQENARSFAEAVYDRLK